jgi:hypothetical protein
MSSSNLERARKYRLEAEILEKRAQIIELGEEIAVLDMRLNAAEPGAMTLAEMVKSVLQVTNHGMTAGQIATAICRSEVAVRHALRKCGSEVTKTTVPGSGGRKVYYHYAPEASGPAENWRSLG